MQTHINVKKKVAGDILIFEFHGELDETNVDNTFTIIKQEIASSGTKKLIFNFIGLMYLNSKSIGYVADIYQNMEDNGGKFYLCYLSSNVRDTLDLVGITSIITVLETEEKALQQLL
jgi:anti-anti-sigma factor